MQPIWTIIVLLCGFSTFNSAPSNVEGALTSYEFGKLYNGYYYYNLYSYRVVRYAKYRYSAMKSLANYYYRAYTYSYNFGEATLYHRAYSYVVRMSGYRTQTYHTSSRQCSNFEANSYGDFIGYFDCPLYFEPKNFTYCCGYDKSHYCCSSRTSSSSNVGVIIGITFGVLVCIGLLAAIAGCIYCCCKASKTPQSRPVVHVTPTTTITTTCPGQGVSMQQQQPGLQWTTATYYNGNAVAEPFPRQSYELQLHPHMPNAMVPLQPPSYEAHTPPGTVGHKITATLPPVDGPPPYQGSSTTDQTPPQ